MKLNIKKSRLEIHKNTKQKALEYLSYLSDELIEYQKGVEHYKEREFSISNKDDLFEAISKSKLIFLGDFHTFDQSSKNLERILKTFFEPNNDIILGVEFVHVKNQIYIENFLSGVITEREFLESINYRESWRFPWTHYKVFFDLAKENNFKIIGLNTEGPIEKRDYEAAHVINKILSKKPNQKFFVLFGELHILPNRLPKITKEIAKINYQHVIVHQNIEDIYWRIYDRDDSLASKSLIIKFDKNEYSLQNSPPWIKYESMIYWYENLCDDPEFDLHEYIIETGMKSFDGNIYENFYFLCKKLNETLELNLCDEELEDFNIFDHQSLENILWRIQESALRDEDKDFYEVLIHKGELFHLPCTNTYYCPSYSINRISILAGFHVFSLIQNKASPPTNLKNLLTYYCFAHYVGYFSSKIFNPFRKCDLYLDLIKKSQKHEKKMWRIISLKILRGESCDEEISNASIEEVFHIGKQIGNLIADLSFYSQSDKNYFFDIIINLSIERRFDFSLLKKIIFELTSQTPNFYQKTKTLL